MLKCTSRSWVQVTLCMADRHRVTEMMRSTDFQIQEALCLASVGQIWSLCFYKDNHRTGQWPGRGLLLAGRGSLQLLGNIKNRSWSSWELLKVRRDVYCCHVESVASPLWLVEDSTYTRLIKGAQPPMITENKWEVKA